MDVLTPRPWSPRRWLQTDAPRADPTCWPLLAAGTCYFEVPFSLRSPDGRPGDVVRGVIDCLVVRPDGSATVLEFKTGEAPPGA